MTRHLIDVVDFNAAEINTILDLAEAPIGDLHQPLAGKGAALIFEKPSARTRTIPTPTVMASRMATKSSLVPIPPTPTPTTMA